MTTRLAAPIKSGHRRALCRLNGGTRTAEDGFSLIEVLIAAAIIAILIIAGAVLFPRLRNGAYNNAAKQELDKIRTAEEVCINSGVGADSNTYCTKAQLAQDVNGNAKYIPGSSVTSVTITPTGQKWSAVVVSKSGDTFTADSDTSEISQS